MLNQDELDVRVKEALAEIEPVCGSSVTSSLRGADEDATGYVLGFVRELKFLLRKASSPSN